MFVKSEIMNIKKKIITLIKKNKQIYKIGKFFYKMGLNYNNSRYLKKIKNFKKSTIKNCKVLGIKYKILLDPENGYIDNLIYVFGNYELETLSFFKKKIKKGNVFVDVGANIGQHSIFVSKLVEDNGKVISFEPIKKLYSQFLKSIEVNNIKNIKPYNFACGDVNEDGQISICKNNAGASSILTKNKNQEIQKIKIRKLDDLIKSKVDFIKIDVEGYEPQVIFGAKNIIKKYKPKILLEYNPKIYHDKGLSMFSFLIEEGYNFTDFDTKNNTDYIAYIKNFKDKQKNIYFELKN